MHKILLSFMVVFTCLIFVHPAMGEEGMSFHVSSMQEFDIHEYPFIYGNVTDSNGNPLSDVEIQATFPSRMILATTNSSGQFSIMYPVLEDLGYHTVTIYAVKDTLYLTIDVTYKIIDREQMSDYKQVNSSIKENDTREKNYDNSKYDLFSRMTNIEQAKQQSVDSIQEKIRSDEQQTDEPIEITNDLENDLLSLEKRNESHNPRNAFLKFLADVDGSIKKIFWEQFLFTEKKTHDAHTAKENAILDGVSSEDAMKIFQKKAAVKQSEIIEYNKQLSIKYGNTTAASQESFDDHGKLPRDD